MNAVHTSVIAHLRAGMSEREGKLARDFVAMSDAEIMKVMFSNVRGRGSNTRGLRLTRYGLDIMGECFRYSEVKYPENRAHTASDYLYIDRQAKLPYYISPERIVVFESVLGIKMKLYGGDLKRLREIEGL